MATFSPTEISEQIRSLVLLRTGIGTVELARLKTLRRKFKLTQADLAGMIGVNRSTLAQWELGSKTPSPEHAKFLAQILAVLEERDREEGR